MNRYTNRNVVIIGAASGIGAAAAKRLAREGAHVLIGDINEAGAAEVAAEITRDGGVAEAGFADLSDAASLKALVDRAMSSGGLDMVYINGADLRPEIVGRDTNVVDIDSEVWDRTMAVNLRGYAETCRYAIPAMLENGGGAIVMTSSAAAFVGEPERPAYAASKAGMNALVRHIASRWGAEGIRANAVAPGLVVTDTIAATMPPEFLEQAIKSTRHNRLGRPEDIAAAVAFLGSEDASWINGQVLSVDGGSVLR